MFNGNCRQGFGFDRSVFGGNSGALPSFADAPPDMQVRALDRTRIMHVCLPIGESTLMGSDTCEALGQTATMGDDFSISVAADDRSQCDSLSTANSDGGAVTQSMEDTFRECCSGVCCDRFDVSWMVSCGFAQGR